MDDNPIMDEGLYCSARLYLDDTSGIVLIAVSAWSFVG